MSASLLEYEAYGATTAGLVRLRNEDAYLADSKNGIFAVADGLGGMPRGDVASALAIQTLEEGFAEQLATGNLVFQQLFSAIHNALEAKNQVQFAEEDWGMATTLTLGCLLGRYLHIAHVGDSGVLHFKADGKSWKKLTKDHTMGDQMRSKARETDKQIYIPEYYDHVLTECLGKGRFVQAQVSEVLLEPKDRVLFYSDGVTKALSSDELCFLASVAGSPELYVERLLEEANARGGTDNATAVAIFIN